ncbi:MAG: hypothetical protein GF320_21355 [Armatimonadia bacterium]|nr:hypothetical protein [Armatimonadia bacterium]
MNLLDFDREQAGRAILGVLESDLPAILSAYQAAATPTIALPAPVTWEYSAEPGSLRTDGPLGWVRGGATETVDSMPGRDAVSCTYEVLVLWHNEAITQLELQAVGDRYSYCVRKALLAHAHTALKGDGVLFGGYAGGAWVTGIGAGEIVTEEYMGVATCTLRLLGGSAHL